MSIDRYELSGSIDKKRSSLSGDVPDSRVITGASAYEIAKANGFVGTEEAWLESLKGRPGDPGAKGDDYILTEEDKKEIAVEAAKLVDTSDIPGGGSVDLTGYATEKWVKEGYQPKGNYALKSEIPSVPVQSVNGKTGAVVLDASAVGADKSGTASLQVAAHNTSATSHEDIRQELKVINDRLDEVPSGGGGGNLHNPEFIDAFSVTESDVKSIEVINGDVEYREVYIFFNIDSNVDHAQTTEAANLVGKINDAWDVALGSCVSAMRAKYIRIDNMGMSEHTIGEAISSLYGLPSVELRKGFSALYMNNVLPYRPIKKVMLYLLQDTAYFAKDLHISVYGVRL